jgi:hypothetical protein
MTRSSIILAMGLFSAVPAAAQPAFDAYDTYSASDDVRALAARRGASARNVASNVQKLGPIAADFATSGTTNNRYVLASVVVRNTGSTTVCLRSRGYVAARSSTGSSIGFRGSYRNIGGGLLMKPGRRVILFRGGIDAERFATSMDITPRNHIAYAVWRAQPGEGWAQRCAEPASVTRWRTSTDGTEQHLMIDVANLP